FLAVRTVSKKIDKTAYYETMGIDRIIICESIQDGVIIDAGSAVTVDIVNNGVSIRYYCTCL
ncbi:hypothetical protein COB11_06900, partial [Candidatus Aerophobetes bacterium]